MSDTFRHSSQAIPSLHRLTSRFDAAGDQINDLMRRQVSGENPDPAEFTRLLEQRATAKEAMQAQFKLHEKPLKTVLTETR